MDPPTKHAADSAAGGTGEIGRQIADLPHLPIQEEAAAVDLLVNHHDEVVSIALRYEE
jgi:hypothetical protein